MDFLIFLVIFIVVGAAIFVHRQREIKALLERGNTTTGRIIMLSTTSRRQSIRYEFKDAHGGTHKKTVFTTLEKFNDLRVGDDIQVVFLPDKPKVSISKALLDFVRAAKIKHDNEKKPTREP